MTHNFRGKNYNSNQANIYMLKVTNRDTRKKCEIYSKLTIKTPGWRQKGPSADPIVNF